MYIKIANKRQVIGKSVKFIGARNYMEEDNKISVIKQVTGGINQQVTDARKSEM